METDWQEEGLVLVTGTDTGVGKTVVTAAIAAAATAAGQRVAVVKPAQTGTAEGEPSDVAEVVRLAAPAHAVTLVEYQEPLAPLMAARFAGAEPLRLGEARLAVGELVEAYDLVLVEGAGGLMVPIGEAAGRPWTLAQLRDAGLGDATTVVVARAGLGTLNHTALTLDALAREELGGSVVIGAWPDQPARVDWANLDELRLGLRRVCDIPGHVELVGVVPEGAGRMEPAAFRRAAPGWLTPQFYGAVTDWQAWAGERGGPAVT